LTNKAPVVIIKLQNTKEQRTKEKGNG